MARLSRAQEASRQELRYLSGGRLTPGELGKRILGAVDLAVPSDGQQLLGVDPSTLLFNRVLAVSPGMAPHTLWYLRTRYLAEPLAELDHPALMRARHVALVLHDRPETSWGAPARLVAELSGRAWHRIYHEREGPAGGVLRAYFAVDGRVLAGLVLIRFEARRPFQSSDLGFIRLVAPLIGQLLRSTLDRERALMAEPAKGVGGTGVVILGPEGDERLVTPAAEVWLQALGNWEPRLGTRLPAAVWSAIAALRAQRDEADTPAIGLSTPAGHVRIEASAGQDGMLAVVFAPEQRLAPPDVPSEWPLTGQERQVLQLVLRGLSDRQIATTLVVSEHTVGSHIAHAYAKLNVHSRGELLRRVFQEAAWPALEETLPMVRHEQRPDAGARCGYRRL